MSNDFNEDYLVSSPDYSAVMENRVIPGLDLRREDRILRGTDQTPLFCSVFRADDPIGTVLVLHGFTENAFKYSELIWSLLNSRYNVVAYDQRGHGRSGRADGLCHPSVTHVDRVEDYVDDLEIVCREVLSECCRPWTIFAHSMGGAVAALYLEKYPATFAAAALCAPMIAPNTGGMPSALVSMMCKTAIRFGHEKKYPFIMKPYSGPEDFETSCAADPARFAWYDAVKASRQDFWNSVPSYRWTLESVNVTRKILSPGAPESIVCPVLLSTAEHDHSVMPEPQARFINRVPKGRHLFVKGSRHEIFRSANDVFFPWWHDTLLFLKEAEA